MWRVVGGVIFLVLATTVAAAQTYESSAIAADFEISGPAEIAGEFSLDAELSGVILYSGDHTEVEVSVRDALVRLVNVPYDLVATQDGSVVGGSSVYIGGEPEVVWESSWTGTASLAEVGGPESTVRVLPQGSVLTHTFDGDALRIGPPTRFPVTPVDDYAALGNVAKNSIVSGGITPEGYFGPAGASNVSIDGPMRLVLYGGDYLLAGARNWEATTGHILNSTTGDPLGQVGAWRYDRFVLVIDAADGDVVVARGAGHLDALVHRLAGSVTGDVALHGVRGDLTADREYTGSYGLAQAIGNLTVDATYGPASTWGLDGEASFAALDAEPVIGSRAGPRGPGLAEAATVSLLAMIVYGVISVMRRGVVWRWAEAWKTKTWLLAPFAARITQENAADAGPRRTITDVLNARGMMALGQCWKVAARMLDISVQTVRQHVDILCAKNAIARVENGRKVFVGPNGDYYRNRKEQIAAALTVDPVGYAIGATICDYPRITQKELVTKVNDCLARPLTRVAIRKRVEVFASFQDRSTVNRSILERVNGHVRNNSVRLIRKERDGVHVRYAPTEALRRVVSKRDSANVAHGERT